MKNNLWRALAAAGAAGLSITPAAADASTVVGLALFKADEPTTRAFIEGMGQGFDWANTFLRGSGERPLFCEPQTITLTVEQRVDIMEQYLKRIPATGSKPLGVSLLESLQEAFPCK
jgi:hypothetical protein